MGALTIFVFLVGLVFWWGLGILAVGFEKYGSEDALAKDAITHLYEVYVKINADGETDPTVHDRAREFFVGMENGSSSPFASPLLFFRQLTYLNKYEQGMKNLSDSGTSSAPSPSSNTAKPTRVSTSTLTSTLVNPKFRTRRKKLPWTFWRRSESPWRVRVR